MPFPNRLPDESVSPIDIAYKYCVLVTKNEARNFYYGIRLLPPPQRRAICAIYSLARRIDDIADDENVPIATRMENLAEVREKLDKFSSPDPVFMAVADAAQNYELPLDAFHDLVDGVEMDVRGASFQTFDELAVYCRRVAGSVGRLSIAVFRADMEQASPLADTLGVAMQLTNILRDVREDAENGRMYLPTDDLAKFGCTPLSEQNKENNPTSGKSFLN